MKEMQIFADFLKNILFVYLRGERAEIGGVPAEGEGEAGFTLEQEA